MLFDLLTLFVCFCLLFETHFCLLALTRDDEIKEREREGERDKASDVLNNVKVCDVSLSSRVITNLIKIAKRERGEKGSGEIGE